MKPPRSPSGKSSRPKRKEGARFDRARFGPAGVNRDFECAHCHRMVTTNPRIAGVNNRNHCPYCLWSLHVDLQRAGDRLAACKGPMEPIGLTQKPSRNKYARENEGELMLIHRCTQCGELSINRIAADDFNDAILQVFEDSHHLEEALQRQMEADGITPLQAQDLPRVKTQLFGKGYSGEPENQG